MKKTLLAAIVVLALSLSAVGGTFAGFSDTERSLDNFFEVSDLDLKVAVAEVVDDDWVGDDFRDDEPWGDGLEPLFDIDDAQISQTYSTNRLLWNAGEVDGVASLHLRLTDDTASIADTTDIEVWYDADYDPDPNEPVVLELIFDGKLASLDGNPIVLGPLPGYAIRGLTIKIHPRDAPLEPVAYFFLAFTVEFQLVQVGHSFSDTETTYGSLESCGEGCTPGAWKNHLLEIGEWLPTGYASDDKVVSVFSAAAQYPSEQNKDLLQALSAQEDSGGPGPAGGARNLLIQAVAALLNAAHPDVDYPIPTAAGVIAEVNAALNSLDRDTMLNLAAVLDGYNNLGSDLCD